MKKIYYRVVEDYCSDSGRDFTYDVVLQTADPTDFASFREAFEECTNRIQERIDAEEDKDDPDEVLLECLRFKRDVSAASNWGQYIC
jgi:hypothetical protein